MEKLLSEMIDIICKDSLSMPLRKSLQTEETAVGGHSTPLPLNRVLILQVLFTSFYF
jgi:hypothetical protein